MGLAHRNECISVTVQLMLGMHSHPFLHYTLQLIDGIYKGKTLSENALASHSFHAITSFFTFKTPQLIGGIYKGKVLSDEARTAHMHGLLVL